MKVHLYLKQEAPHKLMLDVCYDVNGKPQVVTNTTTTQRSLDEMQGAGHTPSERKEILDTLVNVSRRKFKNYVIDHEELHLMFYYRPIGSIVFKVIKAPKIEEEARVEF